MYQVFRIPKRSGGFRIIEAPDEDLKARQKADMSNLKALFKVSPFAHAFQPYKNIVTMAMGHVGKEFIGAMDIEDFFPSITRDMLVKSARLSAIKNIDPFMDLHFYDFGDGKGVRLPQGAPCSPFLANAYLFWFDWRMAWIAHRFGCDYSRYADDMVFSGPEKKSIKILFKIAGKLLDQNYGLKINAKKSRILHKSGRQIICGIVVNEKINLTRKFKKNLRAEVYQSGENISMETRGRMAFKMMVLNNQKTSHTSSEIIKSCILDKKLR